MNGNLLQLAVPIIGLISGLIATYVSLQNRALVAEVRKEIAEMEGRLFLRIDTTLLPTHNYTRWCGCFTGLSHHASLSPAGWSGV